jgi:hypothetical protein
MSAELQTAGQVRWAGVRLSGPTTVRNLDVIDLLANYCKWCGECIFDSSTKPRMFCDNNNVCCNAYSRAKKRGKAKRSSFAVCQARAKMWLRIWEWGKAGSTVDNIRVSRDEVIRASGQTVECTRDFSDRINNKSLLTFTTPEDHIRKVKMTLNRIVERRKAKQKGKDKRREHKGIDVHVKPIEPKSNADRDVLRDLDWAERQKRIGSGKMPRLNTNWCSQCNHYVAQDHEHPMDAPTIVSSEQRKTLASIGFADYEMTVEVLRAESERIEEKYQALRSKYRVVGG